MKEHFVQQAVRHLCSDSPNLDFWAVLRATLACRAFGIDHWKGALGQFTVDTGSAHRLQQLSCLLMPSWPSHRRRTFEVRPSSYLLKIPPTRYRSWCLPFVAIIGYGQGIPECNHFAYSSELVCVCMSLHNWCAVGDQRPAQCRALPGESVLQLQSAFSNWEVVGC